MNATLKKSLDKTLNSKFKNKGTIYSIFTTIKQLKYYVKQKVIQFEI